MAQEQQLPEIKLDATQLYREEMFTDRKAGSLRRLVRLALPQQWPLPHGTRGIPPVHLPTDEALRRLETLFEGEASW